MALRLYIIVLMGMLAAAPQAYAQSLSLNDYSYDTVCDFTNRYFVKLQRRIDPKEWEAIAAGKGTQATLRNSPSSAPVNVLVYSHRGLRVKYSLDNKKHPRIWQVDLDPVRISEILRTKDELTAMFKVTPSAITKPTVSMECDGAVLYATFSGKQVRRLSLVMSAGGM